MRVEGEFFKWKIDKGLNKKIENASFFPVISPPIRRRRDRRRNSRKNFKKKIKTIVSRCQVRNYRCKKIHSFLALLAQYGILFKSLDIQVFNRLRRDEDEAMRIATKNKVNFKSKARLPKSTVAFSYLTQATNRV